MNPFWVSLSTYGGVTTREALFVLWAAGIRQVELAIGVKPSPDTVEVLRHYQQQGMQYRAHHAFVWQGQRSFNLAQSFDASYFERLTDWLVTMDITAYSVHAGSFRIFIFRLARELRRVGNRTFLHHSPSLHRQNSRQTQHKPRHDVLRRNLRWIA